MTKYYKMHWDERRGDEFDSWGTSMWYFEVGIDRFPIRQIELYENGNRLKYHSGKVFDDYGRLGDQAMELNELQEIKKDEFDLEWSRSNPKKEHQEILDMISDYLSNNYDQRFGQALFNLDVNGFINESDPAKAEYRMKDIHGDSDERILERVKSRFERFEKGWKSS